MYSIPSRNPRPMGNQGSTKPVPPSGKRPMPGQGSNKPVPPSGKRPQVMTGGGMPRPDAKVMAMKNMLAKKAMKKGSK